MNAFQRRTAIRIALVSLLLAALTSPLAWYLARENAEESIVALANEQSDKALARLRAIDDMGTPEARLTAHEAARRIAAGFFDVAEIYDARGVKLAEVLSAEGEAIESLLPKHAAPTYQSASYGSLRLASGPWLLRVFVPLRADGTQRGPVTAYFEGIRIVPAWQHAQIVASAWTAALMVALAALLCGAVLYPVVVHLSADNERKSREVLESHISMMEALGRAIAKRDSDTGAHNYRVAWISASIAERMGVAGGAMQALIAGSFLHDVGKIGIPDAILLKPGKLDAAEFDTMRTHVALGEEIVQGMGWLDGAHAVVAAHHEKWDGSGYPRRLAGEAIALPARIFAVADVFDALCSRRPYKEPFGLPEAMAILERDTGSHFDPAVMAVFRVIAADLHARLADCSEAQVRALLQESVRRHFGDA